MVNFKWHQSFDSDFKKNIEDSIQLHVIDVYFENTRPLLVELNSQNNRLEGVVKDQDDNIVKVFQINGNNNEVSILHHDPRS